MAISDATRQHFIYADAAIIFTTRYAMPREEARYARTMRRFMRRRAALI